MSPPRAIVLGSAQDGGVPQPGCSCVRCARARKDPSFRRRVVCLGLVNGAGEGFLVDATPDLPSQLEQIPGLHGLLLTHAHMGHSSGLLYLGKEVMAVKHLPVWMGPRHFEHLEKNEPWASLLHAGHLTPSFCVSSRQIPLGDDIVAEPIAVPHRGEWSETFAFRIRGPKKTLTWCPDIDVFEEGLLATLLNESDYVFLDGTFWSRDELPHRNIDEIPHPIVQDTLRQLAKLTPRAAVSFIHLNHTNPLWVEDSAEYRQLLSAYEEIGLSPVGGSPVGREGLELEL